MLQLTGRVLTGHCDIETWELKTGSYQNFSNSRPHITISSLRLHSPWNVLGTETVYISFIARGTEPCNSALNHNKFVEVNSKPMDPYRNRLVETGINWGQLQIIPAANPLQEWLTELDPTLGWLFQKNRDGLQQRGISLRGRIGIARSGISLRKTIARGTGNEKETI